MDQGPAHAPWGEGGLLLLFRAEQRPDLPAFQKAIEGADRLSVVHASEEGPDRRGPLIELLRDGMTFDVVGLAPGPPVAVPPLPHRLGADKAINANNKLAISLQPGPHLAPGARTLPVVRTLMGVALTLAPWLPALRGIGWPPAGTLIGPDFFVSSVAAWLGGGAFPALGLTAFAVDDSGGMRSEGLAYFTGQELRLEGPLAEDRAAAVRLGLRLVNQLVGQGAVTVTEAIVGPDGQRLMLEPTPDGGLVRVRGG